MIGFERFCGKFRLAIKTSCALMSAQDVFYLRFVFLLADRFIRSRIISR